MVYEDESNITADERKRDTLAVQTVLGIVLLLAVFFWLGIHIGTQEAAHYCAAEVSR